MENQGGGEGQECDSVTKMTMEQKTIMVEFMEDHSDFAKNKFIGNDSKQNRKAMWEILSTRLNGVDGAKKTSQKWQRAWIDLKNKIKKKAADIKQSINKTGGGPPTKVVLTDLELKILSIIGEAAVYGLHSSQVAPLDSEDVNSHPMQPNLGNMFNQQPTTSQMTKPFLLKPKRDILSPSSETDALIAVEDHTYSVQLENPSRKRKFSERSSSPSGISDAAMSSDDAFTPRRRKMGQSKTVAAQAERFAEIGETLNKRMESIDSKLNILIEERRETNSILKTLVAAIQQLKK